MLKHYVEFLYHGILFGESSSKESPHRNASAIKLPKNSYAFRFYDQTETKEGSEVLVGKPKNISGWHYKGSVLTLEHVKQYHADKDTLIFNMEANGYDRVVEVNHRFFPLKKEDVIL